MSQAAPFLPSKQTQPVLFMEGETRTVQRAAKQYLHTGKIVTKDEERAQWIAETYLELQSLAKTAKKCECDTRTVKAVMDELQAAGKLPEVKTRVSSKLGLLAELATEQAIEVVASGRCPANVLPIMLGVSLDKKAALDQEGVAVAVGQGAEVRVTVDLVVGYLRKRGVEVPALDVESTVQPLDSGPKGHLPAPSCTPSCTEPSPGNVERATAEPSQEPRGEGGVAPRADANSPDVFAPKEF